MNDSGVSRAILVSIPNQQKSVSGDHSILTPFAIKEIGKYHDNDGKIIEHFYLNELTTNILDHELQPKSIKILTNEEKTYKLGTISLISITHRTKTNSFLQEKCMLIMKIAHLFT